MAKPSPRAAQGSTHTTNRGGHTGMIIATVAQRNAVMEMRRNQAKIHRYAHFQVPNAEENLNRLLTLKRDLCCYPDCPRKHIYWTPRGKFCGFHRDEALKAMAAAKRARYGPEN